VEIAAGPRRAPDSGSASTGQPAAAANASTAAGRRPAPQPTTSSPRWLARTASRSAPISAGAGRRLGRAASVHGAPSGRPGAGAPASGSGSSGSAKARFRWTGPAGGPIAAAHAWLASDRQYLPAPRSSGPAAVASGAPTSQNRRTPSPYSLTWSTAWLAPVPRSSGGRSAVSTSSGARPWSASTTAGCRLAAAVPEVHSTAAGRPAALAAPSAKNAAERSSRCTCRRIAGCSASASASGAERDPGARHASVRPARASSSTSVSASRRLASATLTVGCPDAAAPRRGRGSGGAGGAGPRLHPDARRHGAPGHGGSTPPLVGFAKAAALLGEAGGAAAYLGYSLGGRLCLRLALDRPELVRALVLVGASPGIQDPAARAERRAADEALAAAVERDGVAAFLDRWPAGPPGWPIPLRAWPPPSGCSAPAPRSRSGSGWPACNRRSSSWPGPWTPSSPPLPPRWRSRSALARTPRCCPAP